MRPLRLFTAIGVLCAAAGTVNAQEFRQFNRIATPSQAPAAMPAGARAVAALRPVPAADIEAAVREIAASWNTPALAPHLADTFYDRSRLLGTLAADVPRDAVLRVVAIQGSQTLVQYTMDAPDGRQKVYSRVSVTVRTQVEYTDAQKGFQRLEGINDLILRFEGPAP